MGDLTGQVLDDRYRVIEPIGVGAMGNVYRGERLRLGRVVAIKVMNEEIPNESSRKRFEREAMAMAKLEHPHCASVLDVGIHDGQPYVVMEFVSGKNLKELLRETGAMPVARAVDITRQVLSGLSHAHEHGVIHRDIKPANVVLSQKSGLGDHVKILDFGLARFSTSDASNLTSGVVLGTPNYMAPEQIRGGVLDQRADLYSCGVMLFELLTGTKPFEAADPVAVCMQHLNDPPPRLADRSRASFGALEEVIARALAKQPEQRFASAEAFSRALVEAAAAPVERPVVAAPAPAATPSSARRSRRTRFVVGAGATVLGLALVIFVATRGGQHETTKPVAPAPAPVIAVSPKPAPAAPAADPIDQLLARANEMPREEAIDFLVKARKTYPSDARLPYHAAKLYLEKMWWADGLKLARAALALDPKLKSDPDLIRLVLRGFNTTRSYDGTLANFLRQDIGDPAKPFLEDTAQKHPNPIVRARASAELRRYR